MSTWAENGGNWLYFEAKPGVLPVPKPGDRLASGDPPQHLVHLVVVLPFLCTMIVVSGPRSHGKAWKSALVLISGQKMSGEMDAFPFPAHAGKQESAKKGIMTLFA